MADVFGEIRSITQGSPSEAAWWRLTRLCDRVPPARLGELIPYVDASLRAWPDRLRIAPRRWIEQAMTGAHTPQLALSRHLHLLDPLPAGEARTFRAIQPSFERAVFERTLAPAILPVRIPNAHELIPTLVDAAGGWPWTALTTDRLDALASREEVAQLTALRVIRWHERNDAHVLAAFERMDPARVEQLALPALGTDEAMLRQLRGRVWPRLRVLDLGMRSTDTALCEGWRDVADVLPALEYLSLDATYSGDHSEEPELARMAWLARATMPETLRALDLTSTLLYIADEPEGLAEALSTIPWTGQLHALSLQDHPVTEPTMRWLADQRHLRALSLGGEVCHAHSHVIAQSFAQMSSLRSLDWSCDFGLTSEDRAASAAIPPNVEALSWLNTIDTGVGVQLRDRPLRELKLSCSGDTLDEMRAVAADLTTLRALCLDPITWADGDDLRLAALAATDVPLTHVGLRQCGEEALRELARAGVSTIELYKEPEDPQAAQDLASSLDVEVWW